MFLSREEILSKKDLKKETVYVPEWNGDVIVSELTAAERDEWEINIWEIQDGKRKAVNARAKLVVASVVDEAGNKVFTASDIDQLGLISGSALTRVSRVAQRISKLTNLDLEEEKGN